MVNFEKYTGSLQARFDRPEYGCDEIYIDELLSLYPSILKDRQILMPHKFAISKLKGETHVQGSGSPPYKKIQIEFVGNEQMYICSRYT